MRETRKILRWITGWILGIGIFYLVLEVGYRFYRYEVLISASSQAAGFSTTGPRDANGVIGSGGEFDKYARSSFSSFEEPLDLLDTNTGFQYRPNTQVHQWLYDSEGNLLPHVSNIHTNNFGSISPEPYTLAKPKTEFRIAVIGDSFCATTTSSVAWPTALEEVLKQDETFKKRVGKTTVKVLNFCLDGTGFVQWPDTYQYKAERFHPDMVVVSFMWNDPYRRFMYRDTVRVAGDDYALITCSALPTSLANPACQSASCFILDPRTKDYRAKAFRIKKEIYRQLVRRLPWFSPYPELLATFLHGRLGLEPKLVVRIYTANLYSTTTEALRVSLNALQEIASKNPKMVVLFHPTIDQCLSRDAPSVVQQLLDDEKKQGKGDLDIVNMLHLLPLNTDEAEIRRWYNAPADAHPSNYGAKIYAQAVAKELDRYQAKEGDRMRPNPNEQVR